MQMTTTHKDPVTYCTFNSSFNHIVTSSESSTAKVWDIESDNQVFEFTKAHGEYPITCMRFDCTERW